MQKSRNLTVLRESKVVYWSRVPSYIVESENRYVSAAYDSRMNNFGSNNANKSRTIEVVSRELPQFNRHKSTSKPSL